MNQLPYQLNQPSKPSDNDLIVRISTSSQYLDGKSSPIMNNLQQEEQPIRAVIAAAPEPAGGQIGAVQMIHRIQPIGGRGHRYRRNQLRLGMQRRRRFRAPRYTQAQKDRAIELLNLGNTCRNVARIMGPHCSSGTPIRWRKRAEAAAAARAQLEAGIARPEEVVLPPVVPPVQQNRGAERWHPRPRPLPAIQIRPLVLIPQAGMNIGHDDEDEEDLEAEEDFEDDG